MQFKMMVQGRAVRAGRWWMPDTSRVADRGISTIAATCSPSPLGRGGLLGRRRCFQTNILCSKIWRRFFLSLWERAEVSGRSKLPMVSAGKKARKEFLHLVERTFDFRGGGKIGTTCSPSPRPSPLGSGGLLGRLWSFPATIARSTAWRQFSLSLWERVGVRGAETLPARMEFKNQKSPFHRLNRNCTGHCALEMSPQLWLNTQ
jgi:hypothetical protein